MRFPLRSSQVPPLGKILNTIAGITIRTRCLVITNVLLFLRDWQVEETQCRLHHLVNHCLFNTMIDHYKETEQRRTCLQNRGELSTQMCQEII